MIRKSILTAFFILCSLLIITAQTQRDLRFTDPESVGLSSTKLQELDTYIQELISENRISGAVCLLARKNHIVHFKPYGYRNLEKKLPMETNSIFRLASMTKPIVSVAAMMLYDDGLFDLDDPVSDYIPEIKNMKVCVTPWDSLVQGAPVRVVDTKQEITIRNLLNHTSGFSWIWSAGEIGKMYNMIFEKVFRNEYENLENEVKDLLKIPLMFQPGISFSYGASTDVLAYLVEKVSNQSLNEFIDERISRPLGLNSTGYNVLQESKNNMALYYYPKDGELIYQSFYEGEETTTLYRGQGGMLSTAEDYYKFCQMLINNGSSNGSRLLKKSTIQLMTQVSVKCDINFLTGYEFGLGFAIRTDNQKTQMLGSLGEYCWMGKYNTAFWIDPKEEIIGILMIQSPVFNPESPYNQSISDAYYPSKRMRGIVYQSIVK